MLTVYSLSVQHKFIKWSGAAVGTFCSAPVAMLTSLNQWLSILEPHRCPHYYWSRGNTGR